VTSNGMQTDRQTDRRTAFHSYNIDLITFFYCIIHVTFYSRRDSRNTLLKKPWGSVGFTRYSDCASSKDHDDVVCFVKSLDFGVKLRKAI